MIEVRGRIAPEHPALPGHFPGAPIVPGVMLLDEVIHAAGRDAANLPWVKFHAPLAPGEEFLIQIDGAKFSVRRGSTMILSGTLSPA